MDFDFFVRYVPKIAQANLPAHIAHDMMSPPERAASLKILETTVPKNAAVLMLLYPKEGKTQLVLILRNTYAGVHSSQIAFPGGKYEAEDGNFINTALRETNEEIGIAPEKVKIIRPFTELYIPPSNFMVYPFLGISKEELSFSSNSNEVAEIIELPLSFLLDDSNLVFIKKTTSYAVDIMIPVFRIDKHIIWGATAMMLNELKIVIANTIK